MGRKQPFNLTGFYHVFNRGVDKRDIFLDQGDFWRFYVLLFLFNDADYHSHGRETNAIIKNEDGALNQAVKAAGRPLVRILSFCLLDNHFHLFIQPLVDGGLSQFMHRLAMGYSKYFNKKYDRSGTLYESEFKAVDVVTEAHFMHIARYINLNVLDRTDFPWRDGLVYDWDKALRIMGAYPWSSHNVFMSERQRLPVVDPELATELFEGRDPYLAFLKGWSTRELDYLAQHGVLGLNPQ